MPVVRELTGELSFKADTTGASRFDAALRKSKGNLEDLNRINLTTFVNTATKAWALVGAAATAGSAIAAKKFIDVEKSLDALKTATGQAFLPLKKEVDSILQDKTLKNLVSEIDLVNASLSAAQEEGATGESIARFLRIATTLGVAAKKPVGEILGNLVKGEVEAILKLIGELPLELQELLKISQTDFAQIGLAGRRAELEKRLFSKQQALEELINEQRVRGLTTFTELGNSFERLTVTVGEGTLPAFKSLNDILIPFVDSLNRSIGTPETQKKKREEFISDIKTQADAILSVTDSVQTAFSNEFRKNLPDTASGLADNFIKAVSDFQFGRLNPLLYIKTTPVRTGAVLGASSGTGARETGTATTNNFNINVQPGADSNIGTSVAKEVKKMLGTVSEQNKQTTKIRGGN